MEGIPAFNQGLSGATIGKYQIADEVGYGGMSVVYRARDGVLDREVAVKVLHPHLAKLKDARRRFQREARAVAKLRHPNIVEIYDFSDEDSSFNYIVTEFIRGPTLRDLIENLGGIQPEVGALIVIQVADALGHAHGAGVLHRDVKPENVMIRPDGVVKLMDFGIAQLRDAQKMTQTGSLLGSPAHMAPEVIGGIEPDIRADIFAMGTVLYYVSTGELPFSGRNAAVVLRAITEGKYLDPEIRDPRIGQKLGLIIRRCLERDPADRFQRVAEAGEELREYVEEVGLIDSPSELRDFLEDPPGYSDSLRLRVVEKLETLGQSALEAKEIARAVDCFNRVLAIDEDHEGVRRLLARLDRRRKVTAYAVAIAVVLGLAAIVALSSGLFGWGTSDREVDTRVLVEQAILDSDQALVLAEARAQEVFEASRARDDAHRVVTAVVDTAQNWLMLESGRIAGNATALHVLESMQTTVTLWAEMTEPPRDDDTERHDEDDPDPIGQLPDNPGVGDGTGDSLEVVALDPILVQLRPYPRTVIIWIDGEEYGDLGQIGGGVDLTPGVHTIDYYPDPVGNSTLPFTTTIEVPDTAPADGVFIAPAHVVPWRDASLLVESNRPAEVFIDDTAVGHTGEYISYSMEGTDGEAPVEIRVIALEGGFDAFHDELTLRAGGTHSLRAFF